MNTNIKTKISKIIFLNFIESRDFNGIHYTKIIDILGLAEKDLIKHLKSLINQNLITLVCHYVNPFIKMLDDLPIIKQIEHLNNGLNSNMCLYPSDNYLKENIDLEEYKNKPFSKMLALGEPQLKIIYFDMKVLEFYFNDPRYIFENQDYCGSIAISEDYLDNHSSKDNVYLKTFGIGYDSNHSRVVAVFIRYLSSLSEEHQQFWNTRIINDKCTIDSDYLLNSYMGQWAEHVSIYDAILVEMHAINSMCEIIEKPPLFETDYKYERPKQFCTILLPTIDNYNNFIHLLDKMLSENINLNFFRDDNMELQEEIERNDGKIIVQNKNSIRLFEEWLTKVFLPDDEKLFDIIFNPLKKVRKLRQIPAHKISSNKYDKDFHLKQNEIISKVFKSILQIRKCFELHPQIIDFKMPDWYDLKKIKVY